MGVRKVLAGLARSAPVAVFPIVGSGARDMVRDLRLRHEVELVPTPRHATVLLVVGRFSPGAIPGLAVVHDQLPVPRATVRWKGNASDEISSARLVDGDEEDLIATLVALNREILADPSRSEPPILPDVDDVEWRGVGPYGHGGKGMTGGTPYGRPLVERAADRDGMELDQLPVTVGPWVGALPWGLELLVKLQGDVIQEVEVGLPVVGERPTDVFSMATHEPVTVAVLELERARHHLRWLADALLIQGLSALGLRALRLSRILEPHHRQEAERLLAMVRRSGVFGFALNRAGGEITGSPAAGLGPVARAGGLEDDGRLDEPAYRELGFEAVLHQKGDAAARWRQRMAEVTQSLDLCNRAGDRTAFGAGLVEGPRGRITVDGPSASDVILDLLPQLLSGLEWGDAVSLVWSLDIDPTDRVEALVENQGTS
ncbi:MAG: hypothetical protein ACC658_11265 [Acidimicrobiia bacterium]